LPAPEASSEMGGGAYARIGLVPFWNLTFYPLCVLRTSPQT